MKRITALALLVIAVLSITSCDTPRKNAIMFREIAFCAEVEWIEEGEKHCARIYSKPSQKLQITGLDAAVVGAEEERYAEYVLPSALEGVRVEKSSGGTWRASLKGAHVSSQNIAHLALPIEMIFADGEIRSVGTAEIDGVKCNKFSIASSLGELIYYVNPLTNFPCRIECGDTSLDFVWVEMI